MRKRTTLYAAFSDTGEPVLNVYDFDKKRLDVFLADRVANNEAVPGEHRVQVTITYYNQILAKRGWPQVTQ